MGDLKGHAIPGTFFLIYGTWWAVGCLWRYLSCRRSRDTYTSTATYRMLCFRGAISHLPMEPFIKVILSSSGVLGELLAHLPVPPPGIVQHATMYFFFLLSGIVDIGIHYGVHLPHGVDYMSMVLALTVEGLLFLNHIHGRTQLDIHLHMLLVYVIGITAVVFILEIRYKNSFLLGMARAYLMLLQGSWFWAVGIILYGHGSPNNGWDENSPGSLMLSTVYFSWHCGTHFVLLILMSLCMHYFHNRTSEDSRLSNQDVQSFSEEKYSLLEKLTTVENDVDFEPSDLCSKLNTII